MKTPRSQLLWVYSYLFVVFLFFRVTMLPFMCDLPSEFLAYLIRALTKYIQVLGVEEAA
jgi:hypothetical protein